MDHSGSRIGRFPAAVVFTALFVLFYVKFVPFVAGLQILVLVSGLVLAILAAVRPETGLLVFLFGFPLVGWWPYLFGLDEAVPHAPTALVLFLFFVLGRLAGRVFVRSPRSTVHLPADPHSSAEISRGPSAAESDPQAMPGAPAADPLRVPLGFYAAIAAVSAVVAFWRFSGWVPFAADRFYEFAVNVNGVTAGGARMSVVFTALNLLVGPALYLEARPRLREAKFRSRAFSALAAGLLAAAAAGFFQRLFDPAFGNTPFWVRLGQINGTLKDPNAFATVLSVLIPLFAVPGLLDRGRRRFLFGAAAVAGLAVFPFIGARGPLAGLGLALICLAVAAWRGWRRSGGRLAKPAMFALIAGLLVIAGVGAILAGKTRLYERLAGSVATISHPGGIVNLSPERYFLWKGAVTMMAAYPGSGVGAGAYVIELPNFYSIDAAAYRPGFESFRRNDSAENLPLHVGAELGLPGMAALLGLAVAIGSMSRRILRADPPGGPRERLIRVAAAAGLLSFAVNALFHSYIGSFESVFAAWFLVSLVAAFDTPRPAARGRRRGISAVLALAVVAFAAVSTWTAAAGSLSPGRRWKELSIPREFGLFQVEKDSEGRQYRWTRAYGALPVPVGTRRIRISVHAAHPDLAVRPVDVEMFLVDGFFRSKIRLGGRRLVGQEWKDLEFALPAPSGPEGLLLVKVSRTWVPLKVTGAPDPRPLGVALGTPSFSPE